MITSEFFKIYHKENRYGNLSRLGIAVNKKVGCSVKRNRLKRITREWFRKSEVTMTGKDFLIVLNPNKFQSSKVKIDLEIEKKYLISLTERSKKLVDIK